MPKGHGQRAVFHAFEQLLGKEQYFDLARALRGKAPADASLC